VYALPGLRTTFAPPHRSTFDRRHRRKGHYGWVRMSVPPFDHRGYLPPSAIVVGMVDDVALYGGHNATFIEVEDALVDRVPSSVTRPRLFHEVEMFAGLASRYFNCINVHIGGDFVTQAIDPKDVVIVLDVGAAQMDTLESFDQWLLYRMFDGRNAQLNGICIYTSLIVRYPDGHPLFEEGVRRLRAALWNATEIEDAGHIEVHQCREGVLDETALV